MLNACIKISKKVADNLEWVLDTLEYIEISNWSEELEVIVLAPSAVNKGVYRSPVGNWF